MMMTLPFRKSALALALASLALPWFAQASENATVINPGASSAKGLIQPTQSTRYLLQRSLPDKSAGGAADEAQAAPDRLATEAVQLMWENKLPQASVKINEALRMRIDRSYYHLINGLIYHLQARQGQGATYDLAEQGYRQAIQFDESNWQARFFAGMLSIDTAKFEAARQQFAQALYLHPDDPALLNAFAYAAYRSGAPDQAAGAINAMEAMGGAQTPAEIRNAAVIMAAVGESARAQDYLARLKTSGDERAASLVERRMKDWREIYSQPKMRKTQFAPGAAGAAEPAAEAAAAPVEAVAPIAAPAGAAPVAAPVAAVPGAPGAPAPSVPHVKPTAPGTENKMVVVDVVLISTEENFSNERGVNLLRGLQIQFGGGGAGSFAYQSVARNPGDGSSTTAITRNITIPSIFYNLNIFNTNDARNEILARPTLVATAERASDFFSGEELNAVVVNSSNNSSASPVNIQKEIGTSLSVTPSFLADGRVELRVFAQRTFIKTPNSNLTGFDARVETSKSKVEASVVMRSGETLILGGLSEKEGESTRDGVPLLQDVPGLQYLFSRSTKRDYQKSTLILVTPRPPQYVYQPENARKEYEKSLTEDERPFANLRARYADWFRPYPNWASVFHHLQENPLYREFRTGDVTLESWTDMRSLKDRLNKVLEFLHY
jgi:Tfp pilus assembly protein PilF